MDTTANANKPIKHLSNNRYSKWSREYRTRKDLSMCGVFIPTDIHKRFSAIAEQRKESKRAVLEACIRNYITQYEANTAEA